MSGGRPVADDVDRRGLRDLMPAVLGPLGITVLFLVLMAVRGEESFAPGEGAGAARRVMMAFALYAAALLLFVVWGTTRARGERKALFALVSLAASAFFMFFAFFSQMAP